MKVLHSENVVSLYHVESDKVIIKQFNPYTYDLIRLEIENDLHISWVLWRWGFTQIHSWSFWKSLRGRITKYLKLVDDWL